ncbi:chemotaxis-specific protein-glutamate methyltransferase CheB [Persicimonas caeni]|uniref:chemotaxis-specific protein-glutamate methyltransferase CheB n=1 Tax=Persicimonas caeni TaxID=2292766 RepID=UPI00143D5A74|nr:chemotaxis-specific protein-glutamate methyltransferase CheB [Persicimonas caeni]
MNPTRILIAEDSSLFATVLREMIEPEPDMEIVAMAQNGKKAVELCAELQPDLVLMDIHMPVMDGLTATARIMARCPTPILVITADPYRGGVDLSFKALSAGALDLVAKPDEVPMREAERLELLRKMRILSEVPVVRHVRDSLGSARRSKPAPKESTPAKKSQETKKTKNAKLAGESTPVVGIAASTGGPKALAQLLGELPADFPAPILLVQHITRGFSTHLTRWLDANSALRVVEAQHGQPIRAGHVYVAPTEMQMELTASRFLKVYDGPAVAGHRPSGDVLLRSLARHVAPRAVGVVLSGMGQDGAFGMAALYRSGSITLVQDEESSVVYSMPRSALERGVVSEVVALDQMADKLGSVVKKLAEEGS